MFTALEYGIYFYVEVPGEGRLCVAFRGPYTGSRNTKQEALSVRDTPLGELIKVKDTWQCGYNEDYLDLPVSGANIVRYSTTHDMKIGSVIY